MSKRPGGEPEDGAGGKRIHFADESIQGPEHLRLVRRMEEMERQMRDLRRQNAEKDALLEQYQETDMGIQCNEEDLDTEARTSAEIDILADGAEIDAQVDLPLQVQEIQAPQLSPPQPIQAPQVALPQRRNGNRRILTTTPITSENPSHHLHDKTSTQARNSNHQRSASSSSDNSIQSCIAHDIPAPTQPKTNHSCSNPAKSAPHQSNRIQLAYSNATHFSLKIFNPANYNSANISSTSSAQSPLPPYH
ncbi:hypothetical protein HNY73_008109 [Argiope bruennichi]|uniref:Uncharacterized protein n=1 Tax=Argiope bruennichi TaxID=94029 RepID=A0A8T0F7T3_ARGBR|nr:hypothetical protein HNY73_008109 [Argiope bruennichi]